MEHTIKKLEKIIKERGAVYGDYKVTFKQTADAMSVITNKDVTELDVITFFIITKLCRLGETPDHEDSWIDIAGYATLGASLCSKPS